MKKIVSKTGLLWILFFIVLSVSITTAIRTKLFDFNFVWKKKQDFEQMVKYFPFSKENCLKEWEEKVLKGRVVYRIEAKDGLSYVRAKSQNTASALYYKIKLDVKRNPVISWKWRVDKFPEKKLKETISGKKEEDFAARVYVMFPAMFFTNSKVIEYIWSETIAPGTFDSSGYSKNVKVMVLEKGEAKGWRTETRNIVQDYKTMFGKDPRLDIGAIAFMTDADSTKTNAIAVYDEITVGYE